MPNDPFLKITVREARENDLASILLLYKELGAKGEETLSLQKAREIFKKMKLYPSYKTYAAFSGGKIVGTFALLIMDNLAHQGARLGIVENVVVQKGMQGKGVGKRMMQFAMDVCRKMRCYKLMLSSNAARKKAHSFYRSLGFEKHGYSFRVTNPKPSRSTGRAFFPS